MATHIKNFNELPSFDDLKLSIRDRKLQEKVFAIEAVEVDIDAWILLEYVKNEYTYHHLKVRFSVFDDDISNQRYISRVVNNFMCFLKTRLKKDYILVKRELNEITYII